MWITWGTLVKILGRLRGHRSLCKGAGATFYARCSVTHPVQLQNAIVEGIKHKGFSFIEVLSPCPTTAGRNIFNFKTPSEMYDWYESQVCMYKPDSIQSEDGKIALGVLYVDDTREELCEVQAEKKEAASK